MGLGGVQLGLKPYKWSKNLPLLISRIIITTRIVKALLSINQNYDKIREIN